MSKINTIKIERSNLIIQIICGVAILAAYFTTKMLMWVVGLVCLAYMFSDTKWEQKISFFMFMLPFSSVFKISDGQTSLFMFLRLAMIFCFAFQYGKKFSTKFLLMLIVLFTYVTIISEIFKTDYLVFLINMVIWLMVSYAISHTISVEKTTPVVRSLSNSIIVTGILGLFPKELPQIFKVIRMTSTLTQDGAYVTRYSGFVSDPNFFSVLIIASMWFIYYEFIKGKMSVSEFFTRNIIVSFLGLMTMSKSCALLLIIFWFYVMFAQNGIKSSSKIALFFALLVAMFIFIWKNPYWLSDISYRFFGDNKEIDASILTTGRSDLWMKYFQNLSEQFKWVYGNGLNAKLVSGYGSHNTIIQSIYNIGVFGSVLVVMLFRNIYTSAFCERNTQRASKVSKYGLYSLLATLFFLDGLLGEMYYYMIPMSFVYMLDDEKNAQVVPEVFFDEEV